jgi:uncharacterized membrane protein (DUF106 family)
MEKKLTINKITELIIQKLKEDILILQQKALAANESNDTTKCRQLLQEQNKVINGLIKLIETQHRLQLRDNRTNISNFM